MTGNPNPFRPAGGGSAGSGHVPMFNIPPVTLAFVLVIGGIFLVLQFAGHRFLFTTVLLGSLNPLRLSEALANPASLEFWLSAATLFTHALIHMDGLHFVANAGLMLAFGSMAERIIGSRLFVVLILASAIGAASAQLIAEWGQSRYVFGASGVVAGCIGAVLSLMIQRSSPGDPRRRMAISLAFVLIGINLAIGLAGPILMGGPTGIAWQAHIGGFLVGFFLVTGFDRR